MLLDLHPLGAFESLIFVGYIMTKDYMQNFNPPGRSYLTGILKGCRQNQIPTEPILKAARKPPVPGQTQKSQPKKQRKAGQER